MAPAGVACAPLPPAGGVQVLQGVSLRALKTAFRFTGKSDVSRSSIDHFFLTGETVRV